MSRGWSLLCLWTSAGPLSVYAPPIPIPGLCDRVCSHRRLFLFGFAPGITKDKCSAVGTFNAVEDSGELREEPCCVFSSDIPIDGLDMDLNEYSWRHRERGLKCVPNPKCEGYLCIPKLPHPDDNRPDARLKDWVPSFRPKEDDMMLLDHGNLSDAEGLDGVGRRPKAKRRDPSWAPLGTMESDRILGTSWSAEKRFSDEEERPTKARRRDPSWAPLGTLESDRMMGKQHGLSAEEATEQSPDEEGNEQSRDEEGSEQSHDEEGVEEDLAEASTEVSRSCVVVLIIFLASCCTWWRPGGATRRTEPLLLA
eukprot:gnl/TRDRNA2_/TRDRNA2_158719_c0_seq1.p1 gnl/TRDRNA2_/TRDRNA2_158719_c0~~gnl/TRDRNA2_/TRDRNA2_158719_c0_seq1.p1  ORF type:complete len:310 (-),score=30.75 gnl/TRDRNA2_/TRDRNA2_158719_c0_seq1:69-998(-)